MAATPWTGRAKDAGKWMVWGSMVLGRGAVGLVRLARGGRLREGMRPWMEFPRVSDVPFDLLASQGVRAVLFDLENTLIPPGGPFTPDGRDIVRRVRAAGMQIAVVSNASASWVPEVLRAEQIPFVAPAGKPGKEGFIRACKLVGVRPAQAVYVGDQMITDILGAQRAGMRAILVQPRYSKEAMSSRFQRAVAKGVLRLTRSA